MKNIFIGFAIDMDGAYTNIINSNGTSISIDHPEYNNYTIKMNNFIKDMDLLFEYFQNINFKKSATWFINEASFHTSIFLPEILNKCNKIGEIGLHTHFDDKQFNSGGKCIISPNKNDWFENGLLKPTTLISNKINKKIKAFKGGCHLRSDEMFDSLGELNYIYDTSMVYQNKFIVDNFLRYDDSELKFGMQPFFIYTKNNYRILEFPELNCNEKSVVEHITKTADNHPIFVRLQIHPWEGRKGLDKLNNIINICKNYGNINFKNIDEMGDIYINFLLDEKLNNKQLNDENKFLIKYITLNYNTINKPIIFCKKINNIFIEFLKNIKFSNIKVNQHINEINNCKNSIIILDEEVYDNIELINKLISSNNILFVNRSTIKYFNKNIIQTKINDNYIKIEKDKETTLESMFSDIKYINNNNLEITKNIDHILIKCLSDDVHSGAGIYYKFDLNFLSNYNFKLPKQEFLIKFKGKINTKNKDFKFKFYTGIKYEIFEKEVTTEYQDFEGIFLCDFNQKSNYRLGFMNIINSLEISLKDFNIDFIPSNKELNEYIFFDKYINYYPNIDYQEIFNNYELNPDGNLLYFQNSDNRFIILENSYFYKSQIISNKNKIILCADSDKHFIKDNNINSYKSFLLDENKVIIRHNFENYKFINFPVFYFKYHVNNYLHFILDTIPYITFYIELKKKYDNLKLFIPMNNEYKLYSFFYDILNELGITEDDMFLPSSGIYNMIFSKLIVVEPTEIFKNNWNLISSGVKINKVFLINDFTYKIYQDIINKTNKFKNIKGKYYYLSRKCKNITKEDIGQNNLNKRICTNEDELINLLKKFNIEVIHAEDYKFMEKINKFNQAEYIFTTYTAGLATAFFTTNVKWIVFNAPSIAVDWLTILINKNNYVKGYDLFDLERKELERINHISLKKNQNWKININKVKKILDSLKLK